MEPPLKPLSPSEWESLIDDHYHGGDRRRRRRSSSAYSGVSLFSLSLSSLSRRDLPLSLKLHLLVFLEHILSEPNPDPNSDPLSLLPDLGEYLSSVIHSPADIALKDQFMVSTVSIFINLADFQNPSYVSSLETLIELLLNVINRPNHGPDRQTRGMACECLRELERARPCLLSGIVGPLWDLAQSERTHATQSYVLLLLTVIHSIVTLRPNALALNTNTPLVPFSVPDTGFGNEVSGVGFKGLRRAISFLLECPQFLTSFGMMEFVSMIMPVGMAMELQASLLKVQFSGLLCVSDPLMCHAYVMMCLRFADAFKGQEGEVVRRLGLVSREGQSHLIFRLLALHWLLGFIRERGKGEVAKMVSRFYPSVFDSLALKSSKIDLLACCSVLRGNASSENEELSVGRLFEDGIVSVSSFKWLPSWSTETAVAFRAFHKFLIGTSSHADLDPHSTKTLMQSPIFKTIQRLIVELTLEYKGLVPVHVSFIDRLLGCDKHQWLGERLLQTFDEHLLPKLKKDCHRLPSYFPIFERIAENHTIPPGSLIELLTHFIMFLVGKHGPDTGLRTWSRGSKVLGICRIMLMHHHSSRLFLGLSRLLAFTCLYFPDLEVRDDARIYLRMLICIPGKKLRRILLSGDQLPGVTPGPQSGSYFNDHSQPFPDLEKSKTISSYIHLFRLIPLLVKQSWSLSLSTLGIGVDTPAHSDSIRDSEPSIEQREDVEDGDDNILHIDLRPERVDYPQEPLRVMDSKVSEIIGSLRTYFSTLPDFRHMAGLKIKIPCNLHFESESFNRVWGSELPIIDSEGTDPLPSALYAIVLKFSSLAPYGSIPSQRIPFLLGEPNRKEYPLRGTLGIVPVGEGVSIEEGSNYEARVFIELEPREPVPGLVDVYIEANTEDGQIIHGQLEGVNVGIEDMFLKPTTSSELVEDERPGYYLNLFKALWEACGSSSAIAHETFPLKGGKGIAAISGTRSVKLIEVPVTYLVQCVEQYLAPFVVCVFGEPLVEIVKEGGIIKDVAWKDFPSDSVLDDAVSNANHDRGPLYLKYTEEEEEPGNHDYVSKKRNMGCFRVLIFLPPRFHLLLQMEVSDVSTLVRIRTDHWPCLAYIDDYLEALFS